VAVALAEPPRSGADEAAEAAAASACIRSVTLCRCCSKSAAGTTSMPVALMEKPSSCSDPAPAWLKRTPPPPSPPSRPPEQSAPEGLLPRVSSTRSSCLRARRRLLCSFSCARNRRSMDATTAEATEMSAAVFPEDRFGEGDTAIPAASNADGTNGDGVVVASSGRACRVFLGEPAPAHLLLQLLLCLPLSPSLSPASTDRCDNAGLGCPKPRTSMRMTPVLHTAAAAQGVAAGGAAHRRCCRCSCRASGAEVGGGSKAAGSVVAS